jgi:hypothetical protein
MRLVAAGETAVQPSATFGKLMPRRLALAVARRMMAGRGV